MRDSNLSVRSYYPGIDLKGYVKQLEREINDQILGVKGWLDCVLCIGIAALVFWPFVILKLK